jgi:hypothetical protein
MLSRAAIVLAATAGCAQGSCPTCPSATLTANGSTDLAVHVGDMVGYAWSSTNADSADSTVTVSPSADHCGNQDGPWVVNTLAGSAAPAPMLACQSGFVYTLGFTVSQSSSGATASSIVTIAVE